LDSKVSDLLGIDVGSKEVSGNGVSDGINNGGASCSTTGARVVSIVDVVEGNMDGMLIGLLFYISLGSKEGAVMGAEERLSLGLLVGPPLWEAL